jgi:hypothetical protein
VHVLKTPLPSLAAWRAEVKSTRELSQ